MAEDGDKTTMEYIHMSICVLMAEF